MRRSVTQTAIRASSSTAFSGGLRAAGFSREGNHLHRPAGEVIHAVHFQASQFNEAIDGSFTVNLVVTSEFLFKAWTGDSLPRNPATALFPIVVRIGWLMPCRSDHWWRATADTNIDSLAADVARTIIDYGLPFFASYTDHGAILTSIQAGHAVSGIHPGHLPLVHAMLAAQAGVLSEAKKQLDSAWATAGESPFRRTIELVGSRLGISVGP
jgi:Domain of unknown function (DUF4304)